MGDGRRANFTQARWHKTEHILSHFTRLNQDNENKSDALWPTFFSTWHFVLQDQEGMAEEKVRSEIWLLDYFPQYGEDTRLSPSIWILIKVHPSTEICPDFPIHTVSVFCLQINRPPAKLNLLTCQVRPNPEDRRTFDLVTRRFIPNFWPLTLYPPLIIIKDSKESSAVQLCGTSPICSPH